jgi:ankyrin repeat protein
MEYGANVLVVNKIGITALLWAAEGGHTEVVQTLLKCSSENIEVADNDGDTPLLVAALYGHLSIL